MVLLRKKQSGSVPVAIFFLNRRF